MVRGGSAYRDMLSKCREAEHHLLNSSIHVTLENGVECGEVDAVLCCGEGRDEESWIEGWLHHVNMRAEK